MSEQTKLDQLGVQVNGIASRQSATEKTMQVLTRQLTKAMNSLATLQERGAATTSEEGAATPEWLTMTDPQKAADVLVETWQWVGTVWLHHHPKLSPCWPLHPRVVEDLRAMRATWKAACDSPAAPALMTGWLVQARRPIIDGITEAMTHCDETRHRDATSLEHAVCFQLTDPPELTLMEVAEWWVTFRGAEGVPAPGLVQLDGVRSR